MERNINVFEGSVIRDINGVYPAGCDKNISCNAAYIREERLATDYSDTNCASAIVPGDVLPIEGFAVANVLTVKLEDPTLGFIWVTKASYDSNSVQCNECCEPLPQLDTPSLEAVGAPTEVSLGWSTIANADNYILERDTVFSFPSPVQRYSGPLFAFDDTGLTNGTTYYYRIKAQGNPALYADSEYGYASATPAP